MATSAGSRCHFKLDPHAGRNYSVLRHQDRKSTRLNSSHANISYAVFCLKKKNSPASNHQRTTRHLVSLLNAAGVSWKAYQEDISGTTCPLTNRGSYAVKHNPFVFFDDATGSNNPADAYCIAHVRPYSELATDLSNNTVARYNFITPNVCNDMHSACAPLNDKVKQGDTWLSTELPKLLASRVYANNGTL